MEAFLGDPGSIDQVAGQLRGASGTVDGAQSHLAGAVSALVPGAWQGSAASAFAGTWATYSSSMTALTGAMNQMAGILTNLAGDLRAAQRMAQDAEDFAHAHGLMVGADGQISAPAAPAGVPPDPTAAAAQAQALNQAQDLMNQARSAADRARTQASGALSGISVPQVQPGVTPAAAALFAQGAGPGTPGSPPSLAHDLWNALRGNVMPNSALGGWGIGLFAAGRSLKGLGGVTGWMKYVQLGRFAPRNELGRFISPGDMSAWQRAMAMTEGDNWIARPFMSDTRGVWSSVGKWGGRAGTVLAFAGGALSQWEQDNGKNLDTSQRVGRTVYRSAVAGGGAIAGAEAGAELGGFLGSFVGPEGTVIGGFIGGVAGGVVGSGAANWVVDHTVNAVGHATDATVHWVGDAGSTAIHAVGDLASDLNPFG